MPEEERERFYWRISLFFILLSPWILYCLSKISINPFAGLSLFKIVAMVGMFVSIAIVILLEMLYSGIIKGSVDFKFWLVNPSVECRNKARGSVKGCTQAIEQKLNRLGFKTEIWQDSMNEEKGPFIQFQKSAKKPVHHFLDHAFSGKATVMPASSGVDIYTRLTFEDTVILETGEMNKLQAINEFIALKSPELTMIGVPFTLYCGLIFVYATVISGLFIGVGWWLNYAMFNSLALTAIGSILLSLFFSFKHGKGFMGWRLVFSGVYLAAIPYVAWMLSKFV